MFQSLLKQLANSLKHRVACNNFIAQFLSEEPVLLLNNGSSIRLSAAVANGSSDINQLMQDAILWGVPKKRVTKERRLKKRFGVENFPNTTRLIQPRSDLVTCERCGDHHEYYTICRTCYLEVKEETDRIKEDIRAQTNPLEPKEKEVLLKFEKENTDDEAATGKFRIIEIERERPKWFTKNLMSKSSAPNSQRNLILNPEDIIKQNN